MNDGTPGAGSPNGGAPAQGQRRSYSFMRNGRTYLAVGLGVLTLGLIALYQCTRPGNSPQVPPPTPSAIEQLLDKPIDGRLYASTSGGVACEEAGSMRNLLDLIGNYNPDSAARLRSSEYTIHSYENFQGGNWGYFNPASGRENDGNVWFVRLENETLNVWPDRKETSAEKSFDYTVNLEGFLEYVVMYGKKVAVLEPNTQQASTLNKQLEGRLLVAYDSEIDLLDCNKRNLGIFYIGDGVVYTIGVPAKAPVVPRKPVPVKPITPPVQTTPYVPPVSYDPTPVSPSLPTPTATSFPTATPPPAYTATPTPTPVRPTPTPQRAVPTPRPQSDGGDGGGGNGGGDSGSKDRSQPGLDDNSERDDSGNTGQDNNNESGSHGRD